MYGGYKNNFELDNSFCYKYSSLDGKALGLRYW